MSTNVTVTSTVVGVPVVNEITQDGIITVLELEKYVWLGLTYGAWFKVCMFIALVLLILERTLSIIGKLRGK